MRIVKYPHPTLRYKSKDLRRVDADLRRMVREMFDAMYAHEGIGLAANQVDLPYRLFILNLTADSSAKDEEHVFINPVISQPRGMAEDREGCLSFPEIYAPVRRPEKISLQAYTLAGQEVCYDLDGLLGRAVQHESDHLDGKLFIDRLSPGHMAAIREDLVDLEMEFATDREHGLIPADAVVAARLAELESVRT